MKPLLSKVYKISKFPNSVSFKLKAMKLIDKSPNFNALEFKKN